MRTCLYILLFLFELVQNQAYDYSNFWTTDFQSGKIRIILKTLCTTGCINGMIRGSCSMEDGDKSNVIQFCSGSNITGKKIVLSTENTSNEITNCTCHFTASENTTVDITGTCPTQIYHGFLGVFVVNNICGDIEQYLEATKVLQFVYINNDTSAESYCKHLKTNVGELKGICFAESFIPSIEKNSTNGHEDNLQLVIIIIVSVVAIVSTLVIIIIVAFCLRNRRLKKQKQSRPPNCSANPSFDQADDSGDEMVYNELYHSRIINCGQIEVKCNSVGEDKNVTSYRNNHNNISASALSKANNSDFQSQNGKSSVNSVSMKNKNPSDDSDDEMVYNELYHSRNTNRGHKMAAYSDYEDIASHPNNSEFQSQNGNSSVYSITT